MPCRVLPKLQKLPRKSPRTGETNAVAQARGQRKISTAVEFDAPRSTIADSGVAEIDDFVGLLACCPGRKDGFRTIPHISPPFAFIATAATHRQEEIITAIVNRESHMIVPPLVERLAMAALVAAAAESPALAHHTLVTTAGFRGTGVQRAKCVHDIVECDRPSCFSRSPA